MNHVEHVLRQYMTSSVPAVNRRKAVDYVVRYLFRDLNAKTFKARLKQLDPDANVVGLFEHMSNDGYLIKNVKLWLLAVAEAKTTGKSVRLRRDFAIHDSDATIWDHLTVKARTVLRRAGRHSDIACISLAEMDALLVKIERSTHVWSRKFINRKMRFIMNAQHIKVNEIHSDLLCKAIRGLYLTWPFVDNELHAENVVKRTIRNQGLNFIDSCTTKKRQTVMKSEDNSGTFYSNTFSIDSMLPNTETDSGLIYEDQDRDLRVDVRRYMSQLCEKRRTFCQLLMGYDVPEFYAWLATNNRKFVRANKFLQTCCEFLDVPVPKAEEFLGQMRQHFAAYSNMVSV